MMPRPLATHSIVLDGGHAAHVREVGPSFYQDLDRDFAGFDGCVLIAQHRFDADWPTWEMHPAGDEILYLVAGSMELHVRIGTEERCLRLDVPGMSAVVPKGCWHTGRVAATATVLFVTPGEGTQNAAIPPVVDPVV